MSCFSFECFNSDEIPDLDLQNPQNRLYKIKEKLYYTSSALNETKAIVRGMRKNWHQIQNVIFDDQQIQHRNVQISRKQINQLFDLLINSINLCDCNEMKANYIQETLNEIDKEFAPLFVQFKKLTQEESTKITVKSISNDSSPIQSYFHAYLDVLYNLLKLNYVCKRHEFILERFCEDLVWISKRGFDLNAKKFLCNCIGKSWIILRNYCNSLDENKFWVVFNKCAKNETDKTFIFQLLNDLCSLQKHEISNHQIIEQTLKEYLKDEPKYLYRSLKNLQPLCCDCWLANAPIEPYQIMWDFFSKRLNNYARDEVDVTLSDLIEIEDVILWRHLDAEYSFEMFLGMLVAHLSEHPAHWGRIKGRIYSQLGPNKVKDLNKSGLFNVLLLYVALTKINLLEATKKFLGVLEILNSDQREFRMAWCFTSSLMIRLVKENQPIETVANFSDKLLVESSKDQRHFKLIKAFVLDFDLIIKYSTNLELQQSLLIGEWINKYVTSCYYQDLIEFLEVILRVLERVISEQVFSSWESSLTQNLYASLKSISTHQTAPPILGTIIAKLALQSTTTLMPDYFNIIANNERISPLISAKFFSELLKDYPDSVMLTPSQEIHAIQAWSKFCLLTKDGGRELTKSIQKLDLISQQQITLVADKGDPLIALIDHLEKSTNKNLLDVCFSQSDRWISYYLKCGENTELSEAVVFKIYTTIGMLFCKLAPALYHRHKSSSILTRLTLVLLLPADVVTCKTPTSLHPFVVSSLKKTWPLFFEALVARFHDDRDTFLERTLRDLVVKYVPIFSTLDSPILRCLQGVANKNEGGCVGGGFLVVETLLDKLCVGFLRHPVREAESLVNKTLKILGDFSRWLVNRVNGNEDGLGVAEGGGRDLLELFVRKTFIGLLEVIMFHNQRHAALGVVKGVMGVSSGTGLDRSVARRVLDEVAKAVMWVTEKHLGFNSECYFQMMMLLVKFVALDEVKGWMVGVRREVVKVEGLRGVGYDKNLRQRLDKLEGVLK